MLNFTRYVPQTHYRQVAELWERVFPARYAVTDRVLRPRIATRANIATGDALVGLMGEQVMAFGAVECWPDESAPPYYGSIQAMLVAPEWQQRGVGQRLLGELEQRLRELGCRQSRVSYGTYRFWSGVPADCPLAIRLFQRAGYQSRGEVIDLLAPLEHGPNLKENHHVLPDEAEVAPATVGDLGMLRDWLGNQSSVWLNQLNLLASNGDLSNVLLLRYNGQPAGCVQTFTPRSQFRGANLVWERDCGEQMGGLGVVLVLDHFRGQGLGRHLVHAAAEHVRSCGGHSLFIDWVDPRFASLYRPLGAMECNRGVKFSKLL